MKPYCERKPLNHPDVHAKTHEKALGADVRAELEGKAAARHGVPKSYNPHPEGNVLWRCWNDAHDRATGKVKIGDPIDR